MANNYIPVKIAGVGYSLPETVVTNDDLTKLYDTSDEWIYSRTAELFPENKMPLN